MDIEKKRAKHKKEHEEDSRRRKRRMETAAHLWIAVTCRLITVGAGSGCRVSEAACAMW